VKCASLVAFRRLACPAIVCGVVFAATPTLAADGEPASPARALFLEGRELAAGGNYAAACPKFEESLRLEVGVGTQFNLADCWEHIGRTASAQALFIGAAASAKAAGQAEREQVLRERAAALEPRLSRLVIEVSDPDPRLVVKRDDLPIDADVLGKAVAVDPATYVIAAKAPGKKPWKQSVTVKAGSKVVTVEVPVLEELEAPEAKPVVAAAPAEKKLPPPVSQPPSSDRDRSPNYKALALGGVGVGALAVGTIFAFRYKSANDDAKGICPSSTGCSLQEIADHDRLVEEATTARSWTYVGFGVGVFALSGAAALYLLSKPEEPGRAGIRALPALGANGEFGASLSGAF